MDMSVDDIGPGLRRIALHGRLDTPGVDQIETRFNAAVVPSDRSALLDLGGVSFISSMGIRMLVTAARSMQSRQTRLVLFAAQPLVRESLETMAIGQLIPIVDDQAAALALLQH